MSEDNKVSGRIWVNRSVTQRRAIKSEDGSEEQILVNTFHSPHATATASAGMTLSLGNYNMARIDVGVSLPCYPEEIDEAITAALALATQRVEDEVDRIRKDLAESGK